jgi:hypothetical protein
MLMFILAPFIALAYVIFMPFFGLYLIISPLVEILMNKIKGANEQRNRENLSTSVTNKDLALD